MKTIAPRPNGEQENRFRAYLQYCGALARHMTGQSPDFICQTIADSAQYHGIQHLRGHEEARLGQLLRNAWLTEIQMRLVGAHEENVVYCNLWLPVQAYYSIYLAARAFQLSAGQQVRGDHTSTLRGLARDIDARPQLFPYPWRILCIGDPSIKTETYSHLPEGVVIRPVSAIADSGNVDITDSYCQFLRTTRDRTIDEKCKDWRRAHKVPRMPVMERRRLIEFLSPTSFFDCMYRMRLRSNYDDADSFLETMHMEREASEYYHSLKAIVWHTLLILEVLIARYMTPDQYGLLVHGFATHERGGHSNETVQERFRVIGRI